MNRVIYFSLFALVALTLADCKALRQRAEQKRVEEVTQWLTGDFNSQMQSRRDSDFFDIRLHVRPIWPHLKGEHWLYVEQATAAAENRPYRQRIYLIEPGPDGQVVSKIYTLPGDPQLWAGAWKTPEKFNDIIPSALSARNGCNVYLKKTGDAWIGSTTGDGCESTLRGAKYATTKVTLKKNALISWDQGFDALGKQVWGATKGGYEFIKL